MELTALTGAATIAMASAVIFLVVLRSWTAFSVATATTRFPHSIMFESAQRYRDRIAALGRDQSIYLATGLVFAVIFFISYLLPNPELFDAVPGWQLTVLLALIAIAAGFVIYRLGRIALSRRRLIFVRDANMAIGHSLQRLTMNNNRVFHDVAFGNEVIDHVVVGLCGIYTVSVVARRPGRDNRVRLKDDRLMFAKGKQAESVERSGRKSAQLAKELGKVVGHPVQVRSVIAVPGWEIDHQESADYLAVNERTIGMLSGWRDRNEFLMNEEVEALHEALTERCTRFGR